MKMLKGLPSKLRSERNVPQRREVRQDCPEDAEDEANEGLYLDVQGDLEGVLFKFQLHIPAIYSR